MIYIVVPAYNEEKTIGRVIRGLFEHGYANIVVVDDGSMDNTSAEASTAGARVLRHIFNRGQGAALETGDRFARDAGAETVVHFDADEQFNPKDIAEAVRLMRENNLDVILGSRFLDGRSRLPYIKKHFLLPLARLINWFLTGVKLTDAHNGFRVLNANALKKIKIMQDGMAHNSEIVGQIKKYNLSFAECPVEVRYSEYGQGIVGGVKIIRDLFIAKLLR